MKPARLRALVLAEWRGYEEPPAPRDRTVGVSDAIAKCLGNLGLKDRLREDEVLRAWRDVVGDFVSRHSNPERLNNGVLFVRVLQPTVHYELDRVWKREILAKLRERFGAKTVREVRFRIG